MSPHTGLVSQLLEARIDTLVVVPLFETGTVPFAALPIDARRALVDVTSVMVAPGFSYSASRRAPPARNSPRP